MAPWRNDQDQRVKGAYQAYRRRRHLNSEIDMKDIESPAGQATNRSIYNEDLAAVHEEVGRLPERYRRAVVLCHFEGLTHAEAARRLGCAPGTVGSLVSRARDMLRTRLARRGLSAGALVLAASLEPRMATAAIPLALERDTIQAALCFATRRTAAAGIVSTPAVLLARGTLTSMSLSKLATAGSLVVGGSGLQPWRLDSPPGCRETPSRGCRDLRSQEKVGDERLRAPLPSLPAAVTQGGRL